VTDLHDHLTELFGSTATDAEIPPLPLQEILAGGDDLRRVRRRRAAIWTAAAAAVAVVAVSLPLALTGHGSQSSPAPTHHTTGPAIPSGAPSAAPSAVEPKEPFVRGTTLHAAGRTFEVGKRVNLVSAGDTVLVGHWGATITWRTLRGDHLVPLPYGADTVPVLSPRGTQVAVSTNPTPQTSRITVYDARTDAEIAHVDLDLPATCCDGGSVQQLSIDATGTVRWVEDRGREAPRMAWHPGSAPRQIAPGNP